MLLKILIFLLIFTVISQQANILAIVPTPFYSHQMAYAHVWKELSLRGHKLTLVTTDPLKDPNLTNLTEIDVSFSYNIVENLSESILTDFSTWSTHQAVHDLSLRGVEEQLSYYQVQNLIHNKSHFDVIFVEFPFPEYLAFAEIYNCPKIIIFSHDATDPFHHLIGNPISTSIYSEANSEIFSFKQRIISAVYTWYSLYFHLYKAFPDKNEIVKKYFNISKTVKDLVIEADLIFTNVIPVLQPVRATGISTINIGGSREVISPAALPQDVAEFMDSAVDGFIYFSLGSIVKSKDLDKLSQEAITETFRELPYKILWKYEADILPNKPDNVKLIKWAPQQNVLSHRNIKLFITQGGLQSIEDGFYREVPFVVIPFVFDQHQNAKFMEAKGIAVVVDRIPYISKVDLRNAILEVATNPKYKDTVKRLKSLALDFPMTGLEKAIWWTEYVIRNKGAEHLKNPAADLPFYQYYLIDVICFIILSIIFLILLLYWTSKLICKNIKSYCGIQRIICIQRIISLNKKSQ